MLGKFQGQGPMPNTTMMDNSVGATEETHNLLEMLLKAEKEKVE